MPTSLCYVPKPTNGAQIWMERIADWQSNTFVVFTPKKKTKRAVRTMETTDRILIHQGSGLLKATTGMVAAWDWVIDNTGKITIQRFRDDIDPIQVLQPFPHQDLSISDIANKLKKGLVQQLTLHANRVAVLARESRGFILDRSSFEFTDLHVGSLKSDIIHAPAFVRCGQVLKRSFSAADGQFVDFSFFSSMPEIASTVLLTDQAEAVRQFLVRKMSKRVLESAELTRADRQNFMKVLQNLDLRTFSEELAESLGCDTNAADNSLAEFKLRIENLDLTEDGDSLLRYSFDNNKEFRAHCISAGEKRWREQNESVIREETKKKDSILSALDSRIENSEAKVKEQERILGENDAVIREQEKEIQQKQEELAKAEEAVKERLAAIRSDIPKAFAEMSVLKCLFEGTSSAHPSSGYMPGVDDLENTANLDNPRSAWGRLRENLNSCGCSDTKAQIAALWLLGCSIRRQPLLLVGSCAEVFAQAISRSLFGAKPAVLDCSCPNVKESEGDLIADSPAVCIVRSPFAPEWIGRLPGLFSRTAGNTLFLGCTPFHEDLSIEPPSFFHAMLPLLTDVFCDSPAFAAENHFAPGKMGLSVQAMQQLVNVAPTSVEHADGLRLTLGAKARIGRIFATMSQFGTELPPFTEKQLARSLGAILPLAVATGKNEIVEALVKSVNDEVWGLSSLLA